jgi:hypothetical protein
LNGNLNFPVISDIADVKCSELIVNMENPGGRYIVLSHTHTKNKNPMNFQGSNLISLSSAIVSVSVLSKFQRTCFCTDLFI